MSAAAHIPPEKIDEVRLRADIVEVVGRRIRLVQKGRDFWGVCPFHGDKDPSLKVDRGRGTWHCFGCGEGGSVFNFVMKDQGLSFPEAVRDLAGQFGVDLPAPRLDPQARQREAERERLLHVLQLAGTFFSRELASPGGGPAREYLLHKRGLDQDTVRTFGLGYAPGQWEGLGRFLSAQGVAPELGVKAGLLVQRDSGGGCYDRFRDRVVFPIRDLQGRAVSFGGRIIGPGEPKYLNGPESPLFHKSRTLYNLDQARPAMRQKNRALVVEGYFDVITMAAHGLTETVAPMGTALTAEQVRLLKSQAAEVVLIMDGDNAGRRAAQRALPICLAEGLFPRVALLPAGEDPDSLLRAQGAPAMEALIAAARPLVESVLDDIAANGDLTSPEGKSAVVAAAGEVIKAINDPVTRAGYLQRLARRLDLPQEIIAARLGLPLLGRTRATGAIPGRGGRSGDPVCLQLDAERSLLELALAAPAAARELAAAGALDELTDPGLREVGQAILALIARGAEPSADAVAQQVAESETARLVGQLTQCSLSLDPTEALTQARSHLDLWRRQREKSRRAALTQAVAAAEARGDQEEVARLLAQRRNLTLTSPTSTGKD